MYIYVGTKSYLAYLILKLLVAYHLIIVVKMSCELLYIIQVKAFLIKSFTSLALLDIKAFGCLSLDIMLLLIGLTLFNSQAIFV